MTNGQGSILLFRHSPWYDESDTRRFPRTRPPTMTRLIFSIVLVLALAVPSYAGEPIQFARTPDISPDGKTVAFSYLGDLWLVDAQGGVARHLTMHEKHDYEPIFSPDGKSIAFSSNRHGSYDVYVMPTQGGKPVRLTYDSAEDHVTGWSPNGEHVLFAS